MAIRRTISDRVSSTPIERPAALRERRRASARGHLATGTLACPGCDAPVAAAPAPMAPTDPLTCGFCRHEGAVRDFLSLAVPSRPTRVQVRVLRGPRATRVE